MVMALKDVVPFGRSLDEYRSMFSLSGEDMDKRILGIADGPASFNAEMAAQGKTVVSVDPVFAFGAEGIEKRFYEVVDDIIAQVNASPDDWVWTYHESVDNLRSARIRVLQRFLADFPHGKREGRYKVGELPRLDFADEAFDLALCSHFLFLYSDLLDLVFHTESVTELLRVAREVRIFPLLSLDLEESPHLQSLVSDLGKDGYEVVVEPVMYELQRGGNKMLRIRKK
jgi:hypothetical protein